MPCYEPPLKVNITICRYAEGSSAASPEITILAT
jgi:hypothetical protein